MNFENFQQVIKYSKYGILNIELNQSRQHLDYRLTEQYSTSMERDQIYNLEITRAGFYEILRSLSQQEKEEKLRSENASLQKSHEHYTTLLALVDSND